MKKNSKNNIFSFFGKKIGLGGLIIACLIAAALAAALTYYLLMSGFGSGRYFRDARKYVELERVIEENYIENIDTSELYDAAAAALVRGTGDKWSYYMSAREYESYKLSKENEYAGIGVSVSLNDKNEFEIMSVDAGTPAEKAGLQPGMLLKTVDGVKLKDMSMSEVQELIRSKLNTDFKIGVEFNGDEKSYTIECKVLYKNPVSSKMTDGNVGYVRIANFEAGSSDAAIDAVEQLIAAGAESFVFDVRSNPGGLLRELKALLDYLLPNGDIFVSVDREGKETVTESDKLCLKYKMAVLVNEDTYSAAEFFAAALQEYNWATIVGQHTTGKARSQITIELSDGGAVHISTNKYLTPHRVDLSDVGGVNPDIIVANDAEDGSDVQLNRALQALR